MIFFLPYTLSYIKYDFFKPLFGMLNFFKFCVQVVVAKTSIFSLIKTIIFFGVLKRWFILLVLTQLS